MTTLDTLTILAAAAAVVTAGVAWLSLSAQRRRDREEADARARAREESIISEMRGVREALVRLETMWQERDRSADSRRADWLRQAREDGRRIVAEAVRAHLEACPGADVSGVHDAYERRQSGRRVPQYPTPPKPDKG